MHIVRPDTSERRFEVECKLESELASLNALQDAVERSEKLTTGVVTILSSLDQRLATLRQTILPVYNETGNLQTQLHNIEKTLTVLDHAIGYYGVCLEVESAVRAGPSGSAGLNGFLESLNRLYNAQRYFQKNNPSSVELENITTLFGVGLEALYTEFHDILTRQSKPVLPIILLDLISSDEDTSGEDAPQSLCQLPESIISDLLKISLWLEERGHQRHAKIYSTVRSTIFLRSLQLLKEHQKSASGGSMCAGSPMPKPKFVHRHSIGNQEHVGRRTSRKFQHAIEKKASKIFSIASQTTGLGLSLTNSRKQPTHQSSGYLNEDLAPDEQEMENYLLLTAGLHKLMQAERSLVAKILSNLMQAQVLEATVRDAMDLVAHDGESIATRAKRCIARRDFSAVLVVFPILKHLGELKPDLERTVEGCDYALRSKFASVLNTLNATGAKALEDFAENVRNESSVSLPKDGTVAESTSNVLVFLEQLVENADTAGLVLQRNIDANSITTSPKELELTYKTLLGVYIKKVLAQLNLALVSKSDTAYSDPALRALFRLNNHNYVVNALRRCSLIELLLMVEPNAEKVYDDLLLRNKCNYVSTTFAKARSYIEIPPNESELGPRALKDKFSGVTKEFEDISKSQRSYSVPDSVLREQLRKELHEAIIPYYATFYNKYRGASFSKNPGKYAKYTPDQVSVMINTFFDTAA